MCICDRHSARYGAQNVRNSLALFPRYLATRHLQCAQKYNIICRLNTVRARRIHTIPRHTRHSTALLHSPPCSLAVGTHTHTHIHTPHTHTIRRAETSNDISQKAECFQVIYFIDFCVFYSI